MQIIYHKVVCATYNSVILTTDTFLIFTMFFLHLLAPAVTVGETEGAMDSTSVFFWPLLLPITL